MNQLPIFFFFRLSIWFLSVGELTVLCIHFKMNSIRRKKKKNAREFCKIFVCFYRVECRTIFLLSSAFVNNARHYNLFTKQQKWNSTFAVTKELEFYCENSTNSNKINHNEINVTTTIECATENKKTISATKKEKKNINNWIRARGHSTPTNQSYSWFQQ